MQAVRGGVYRTGDAAAGVAAGCAARGLRGGGVARRAGAGDCEPRDCVRWGAGAVRAAGEAAAARCGGDVGRDAGGHAPGAQPGERGGKPLWAGGVLAADGAVQRLPAAARARVPAQLCSCGRGDGPRLLGADLPRGDAQPRWQAACFRPGIGLLAAESRVPIVPVALVGLGEIRASGKRWFRSGKIEVRIGRAIAAASEETDPAELTARLEEAVRGLMAAQPNET